MPIGRETNAAEAKDRVWRSKLQDAVAKEKQNNPAAAAWLIYLIENGKDKNPFYISIGSVEKAKKECEIHPPAGYMDAFEAPSSWDYRMRELVELFLSKN